MARSIVKQPNGLYAVFSSVVDDFVATDATEEELIEMLIQEQKDRITEEVHNTVRILNGEHWQDCYPYYTRGNVTWEECEKTRKMVHGE